NAAGAFFKQVFRDGFFHADLHPGNMFVDADGALAVVDFGIMGRLDRQTRYYLADMLIGFLSGDYRRVAQVHFDAGYVPRRRSIDAFTQACRSIGEPNLDKLIGDWAQEGVVLHAESLATQAAHRVRLLPFLVIPLWIAAAALVAIAAALLAR